MIIVARHWRVPLFVGGLALQLGYLLTIPGRAIAVPGRDDVHSVLWPLSPVLAIAVFPRCLEAARSIPLITAPGNRAVRLATLCFAAMALGPIQLSGPEGTSAVLLRNTAFLAGLALLGTTRRVQRAAGLLVVLVPASMWLIGTRSEADAARWAVLLRPADDQFALVAALASFGLGAASYLSDRLRADPEA